MIISLDIVGAIY